MGQSRSPHPLRVFLCHSSGDKPAVRELYRRLAAEEGIQPWLDEEDLIPGQDWAREIPKAVRDSDIVVVCISQASTNKAGYLQKELKYALDVADEQPEGTIFLIPLRLEACEIPERLRQWQWVDYFEERGYERLLRALRLRARTLKSPELLPTAGTSSTQAAHGVSRTAYERVLGPSLTTEPTMTSPGPDRRDTVNRYVSAATSNFAPDEQPTIGRIAGDEQHFIKPSPRSGTRAPIRRGPTLAQRAARISLTTWILYSGVLIALIWPVFPEPYSPFKHLTYSLFSMLVFFLMFGGIITIWNTWRGDRRKFSKYLMITLAVLLILITQYAQGSSR